jgi:hypothetical protein
MINFITSLDPDKLVMQYSPDNGNDDWLVEPLESAKEIPFSSRAFNLRREIYLPDIKDSLLTMDAYYHFGVGALDGEYYLMDRRFLGITYNLYLHESLNFRRTLFVAETNIPIFRGFNDYGLPEIRIGGHAPDAIPAEVFESMLKQFPTSYELKKYARARVSGILRSYIPIATDFAAQFLKYREKKASAKGSEPKEQFSEYESEKFLALIDKIETMLNQSNSYSERQWQNEILQVIQFLYPKYICAFPEAPVRDSLANKDREIDFLLVDASGYVDAIEIKQPFAECIVTSNCYRDNHVPMRELSGAIMQLEKYLYHLNRWGQEGEKKLNTKYKTQIPDDLEIKIVNPAGIIIMGRDNDLTPNQKSDFEIIRRKYRHVADIMTYDDLLRRLKCIHAQFSINTRA